MLFLLKPKIMVPLALITGIFATFAAYKYMESQKEKMTRDDSMMQKVVVAAQKLPLGTKLTTENLMLIDMPKEVVVEGSLSDTLGLINRVVKTEIYKGEAIFESKLAVRGSGSGFAAVIPPGMRAMTVAVNVVSGVSGFILPGARVDVLATVPSFQNKEMSATKIILENIEVLAVDQTVESEDNEPITVKSVTLLVMPDQAEVLALASNEGKLQLTLRNLADQNISTTSGVRLRELLSGRSEPSTPTRTQSRRRSTSPPASRPDTTNQKESSKVIEVIRSNVRSEVIIKEKEGETTIEEQKQQR